MAVSSITPSTANNTPAPNSIQQQFAELLKSLNSGDLAGAQQAYSALSQSPAATKGPLASALQQIGSALQSGNIADAKQALTSLQQQFAAHRGHHHHGGGSKQADSSSTTAPSATTTAAPADPSVGANVDTTA